MRWLMKRIGQLTPLQFWIITIGPMLLFYATCDSALNPPGVHSAVKRFERQRQEQWAREEQQAIQAEQQDQQNESDDAGTTVTESNVDE